MVQQITRAGHGRTYPHPTNGFTEFRLGDQKPHVHRLAFKLNDNQFSALEEACAINHLELSAQVRDIISYYMKHKMGMDVT